MSEWELVTLNDVTTRITKGTTPTTNGGGFTSSGVAFVKVESILPDSHIDFGRLARIDELTHQNQKRSMLAEDDVLFTIAGTIGRVARVTSELLPANTNQAVAIVRPNSKQVDPRYLLYSLRDIRRVRQATARTVQSVQANLSWRELGSVEVTLPPMREQRAIAEVLGALDDKITANEKTVSLSTKLTNAKYLQAAREGVSEQISGVVELVTRGVAPRYTESDGLLVLNQKCVRDQAVNLDPARRMEPLKSRYDRLLKRNDVLVNSTGQGTLGRCARWLQDCHATVDTHITIVRFDPTQVDPVCAGYGLLQAEPRVEALAEGSTAQTELKRDLLEALELRLPQPEDQLGLGTEIADHDQFLLETRKESQVLASTRDELLPLLMSGKIRVKDAEKVVEEAT